MNKKGFTLIELLAVIVVLAVIMSIAGASVLNQKKKANQSEVESIYNDIKTFGPDVYIAEKDKLSNGNKFYFDIDYLKRNGYMKSSIQSPANSKEDCEAYLLIDKDSDNNMFDAYVNCPGLKEVGINPEDKNYIKIN